MANLTMVRCAGEVGHALHGAGSQLYASRNKLLPARLPSRVSSPPVPTTRAAAAAWGGGLEFLHLATKHRPTYLRDHAPNLG